VRAARLADTMVYTVLRPRSVTFTGSGDTIRDSSVAVTKGRSVRHASGNHAVQLSLTWGADQAFKCPTAGTTQTLSHITQSGLTLTLSGSGNLTAGGVISGGGVTCTRGGERPGRVYPAGWRVPPGGRPPPRLQAGKRSNSNFTTNTVLASSFTGSLRRRRYGFCSAWSLGARSTTQSTG